jgi:hypothetical protein
MLNKSTPNEFIPTFNLFAHLKELCFCFEGTKSRLGKVVIILANSYIGRLSK